MIDFGFESREEAIELLNSETPNEVLDFYNTEYHIDYDQVATYQQKGYIKLEKVVIDDHITFIKRIMEAAIFIRKESDKRTLTEKSNYEQSFFQCGYLCFDFPTVNDFVRSKRFAGIADMLMQSCGIRLWHDQALFKEAGGRTTPVHQDSSYWPLSNPELSTTLWLSINGAKKENGSLYFYPKSHKTEREYVDIFKNPHSPNHLSQLEKVYTELEPGDATYHSGLTFHGTEGNLTDIIREGMTIIYISDTNRFNDSDDRNSTHRSCEGLKNHQIVNTIYTPKLI